MMEYFDLLSGPEFKLLNVINAKRAHKRRLKSITNELAKTHANDEFWKTVIDYAFFSRKCDVIIDVYNHLNVDALVFIKYVKQVAYLPQFTLLAREVTLHILKNTIVSHDARPYFNDYLIMLEDILQYYNYTINELINVFSRTMVISIDMNLYLLESARANCINIFKTLCQYVTQYSESKQSDINGDVYNNYITTGLEYAIIHNRGSFIDYVLSIDFNYVITVWYIAIEHLYYLYITNIKWTECIHLVKSLTNMIYTSDKLQQALDQLDNNVIINVIEDASVLGLLQIIQLLLKNVSVSDIAIRLGLRGAILNHRVDIVNCITAKYPLAHFHDHINDWIHECDAIKNYEAVSIMYNLYPNNFNVSYECTCYLLNNGHIINNNHACQLQDDRRTKHILIKEAINNICYDLQLTSYDPNICSIIELYESYEIKK